MIDQTFKLVQVLAHCIDQFDLTNNQSMSTGLALLMLGVLIAETILLLIH